ncbi:phage protease [Rhodobacter maris]|uniref:Phage I-like protein n=1 Tax=Rhodobacter maris TaxID=446682 RepID=A0A285TES8_9RHOB|nr:phage protease [Rhodobacter maris]SOC20629.1 phage I-like protein [Rhodobacter maris]
MSTSNPHISLMQAQPLPHQGEVPDWIHLIPAGAEIMTQDRRGPYRLDTQSVVTSLAQGTKLPIDENHAIDLAGPRGEPSPARGYITELQARADGIWGRVDWTEAGRALMADRAYLGISPAVVHDGAKRIIGIARASLTNKPNLRGLTALHQETPMSLAAVAKALGLSDDAGEDQILGAIGEIKKPSATETALQSSLAEIGVALGVTSAKPEDILAAAKAGKAPDQTVVALQAELATVTTELNTLKTEGARGKATAFVDGAIKDGRVGVKPLRDHYIAMHMQDPARVEKEIGAMPVLNGGVVVPSTPQPANGEIALQSAQIDAAKALGLDPKAYAATLKTETL